MGYSLGAFHGFFMAAADADPASPLRALRPLRAARSARAPRARPRAARRLLQRAARLPAPSSARRRCSASCARRSTSRRPSSRRRRRARLQPPRRHRSRRREPRAVRASFPFTNLEAEYLIGLAFRRTLQSRAVGEPDARGSRRAAHAAEPTCGAGRPTKRSPTTRTPSICTASCCPTTGIGSGLVRRADELVRDERSARDRRRRCAGTRSCASSPTATTSSPASEDIDWLTELVGAERVAFFPTGGHLGNLHQPEVQGAIMDSLADLRQP